MNHTKKDSILLFLLSHCIITTPPPKSMGVGVVLIFLDKTENVNNYTTEVDLN